VIAGIIFPSPEIPSDTAAVTAYLRALDALGYDGLIAYDHVVGVDPAAHPGWSGRYSLGDAFAEPFVLLAYAAGLTRLELATGVLNLPQRNTVLVAKQAAQLDVLSAGRLRLGVGTGWSEPEMRALGALPEGRNDRMLAQVDLLRRLWTEKSVTHAGADGELVGVGLNPRPVQRPIPVWFGAGVTDGALRRVARTADGWIPRPHLGPQDVVAGARRLGEFAAEAGRAPDSVGVEVITYFDPADPGRFADQITWWRAHGIARVAVNTMHCGLRGEGAHLEAAAAALAILQAPTDPEA
jgi:probable F420-dependent oxidoreductase